MVPLFRERRCIMPFGFLLSNRHSGDKEIHYNKMAGASKHNEYMKNFVRTEALVSGIE